MTNNDDNLADIDPLVGRHFVSSSDNTCRIMKIGEGALRVTWRYKPTDKDKKEFEVWAEGIVGLLNPTVVDTNDLEVEAKALKEWQNVPKSND